MNTAPTTTAYRNRFTELADKNLFGIIFLVGAVLMIIFKRAGASQVWVTVVPITGMVLYAVYVLLTPRYRIRSDRAGDSLYYLGFLFTMVSLAYSLYEFSSTKGGTESIVTNFGVALATTILGLTLRVIYHQLREDPFEVEREVRIELADAAGKLRGELLDAAGNFKALSTAAQQHLDEHTKAVTSQIARVVDQTSTTYSKAVSDLTELVRSATTQMRQQQATMRQTSSRAATAMENLASRLDAVEFPVDNLVRQMNQMVKEIDTFLKTLSDRSRVEQDRIQEIHKLVGEAESAIRRLSSNVSTVESSAAQFANTLKTLSAEVEGMVTTARNASAATVTIQQQHVDSHAKLVKTLAESTETALKVANEHQQTMGKNVAASSDLLSQVQNSLISLVRTISEKLDGKPIRG